MVMTVRGNGGGVKNTEDDTSNSLVANNHLIIFWEAHPTTAWQELTWLQPGQTILSLHDR
jgi:hypothetical protein